MKKFLFLILTAFSMNVSAQELQAVSDSVDHSLSIIRDKQDELMIYLRAQELTPERRAVADSIARTYMQLYSQTTDYLKQQLESHRKSPECASLINKYQRMLGLDYLEEYMDTYPHAALPELEELRQQISINKRLKPGSELIDFELPDEVGVKHRLSEYIGHGRYVLVDFWASWCGPCIQELPNVVAAYERFHERGFDIVGLSFDTNRQSWLKAVAKHSMTWTQLSDLKGWESLAAKTYNVRAIPFTILFDPDGKIVDSNLRGEALSHKLEELIGK